MTDTIKTISSDRIVDPEYAMRSELDRDSLFELADNIKQNGLINPITVRPKGDMYEVVAGHRRFSACKIAGKIQIECVVRDLDDDATFSVMAAENLERADVDILDESLFIAKYIEQSKLSIPEVAKKLRRGVKYVEDRLSVGSMPEYMKTYLKQGKIKLGAALAYNQITNDRLRESWTHIGVSQGTSVAGAEYQLHDYTNNKAMYDGIIESGGATASAPEPKPVMFRDAITGEEFDARLCKTIIVSEDSLAIFNAFVTEFRKSPAQI